MQVRDKNAHRRLILILALACLFFELGIAPNIALANGHINFCLIFSALVALSFGGPTGVVAGFFSGLVFDLASTGPVGLMSLLLTISSYVLGIEVRNRLIEDPSIAIRNFAIADISVCVIYACMMLVSGDAKGLGDALIFRALPTAFLSFVAFLPFDFFLSSQVRKGPSIGVRTHFKNDVRSI